MDARGLDEMKRLVGDIFALRHGERGVALALAAYHFVLLLCLYVLKPVRDGLFLTDRGTAELPLVFLLVAVATIPASLFQRWLGRRFHLDRLTNRLTAVHVVALVGLGALALIRVPGASYAVYVYVSLYGVLATSQFWLFAGGLLDSAQSKRTFALLNLGGILGAVAGGELTGWLLGAVDAPPTALLLVAAVLLALTTPFVVWIRRIRDPSPGGPDVESPRSLQADVAPGVLTRLRETVQAYPLVGWIAALVAVISVVSTILDYQLKTIAAASFATEVELTTFLGHFYGRVSLVALALQLLLATGLRRRIRSTSALWVLPTALALGATAVLVVPGLVAVTLLRGADQSLKHSIDKTGRELLYLPLPQAVKRRLKVPVDLVVDQVAYGVGGGLLLVLVNAGVGAVGLSWVVLGLVGAWIAVVFIVRQRSIQQYRQAIQTAVQAPTVDADEEPHDEEPHNDILGLMSGDASPAGRERALQHGARYLILSQLLALQTGADPSADSVIDRSQLPRASVLRERRRAVLVDLFDVLAEWIPEVQRCSPNDLRLALQGLRHEGQDVRSDAVSFLDGLLSGSIRRRLVPLLDDPDGHQAMKDAPPLYLFAVPGEQNPDEMDSQERVGHARRTDHRRSQEGERHGRPDDLLMERMQPLART